MWAPTKPHSKPKRATEKKHSGPALEKPLFNWNVHDRYVKLMNFEMEVTNILEMKVYELTDGGKIPVIRNLLG